MSKKRKALTQKHKGISWLVISAFALTFGISCGDGPESGLIAYSMEIASDSVVNAEVLIYGHWRNADFNDLTFWIDLEEISSGSEVERFVAQQIDPPLFDRDERQVVQVEFPEMSEIGDQQFRVCFGTITSRKHVDCKIPFRQVKPEQTSSTTPNSTTTVEETATTVMTSTTSTTSTSTTSTSTSSTTVPTSANSSGSGTSETSSTVAPSTTVAPTTTVSNPLQVSFAWSGSSTGCPANSDLYAYLNISGHTATPSFIASAGGQSVTSYSGWDGDWNSFALDQWPALSDGEHTISYTVTAGTYSRSGSATVTYACNS